MNLKKHILKTLQFDTDPSPFDFGATTERNNSCQEMNQIKERFKNKMSTYIIQQLNAYLKGTCKVGRITSKDDFKYLARKVRFYFEIHANKNNAKLII